MKGVHVMFQVPPPRTASLTPEASRSYEADVYLDGNVWRWRAYVRDGESGDLVAEKSGGEDSEKGALSAAEFWLFTWGGVHDHHRT